MYVLKLTIGDVQPLKVPFTPLMTFLENYGFYPKAGNIYLPRIISYLISAN